MDMNRYPTTFDLGDFENSIVKVYRSEFNLPQKTQFQVLMQSLPKIITFSPDSQRESYR
jgi:hypothetical protein